VWYIYGHMPVFQHEERDVRSFRMFTSQMIVNGTVKPKEIVQSSGVPMITVKRYVKLYREQGAKGFYEAKPRHSSASVLTGDGEGPWKSHRAARIDLLPHLPGHGNYGLPREWWHDREGAGHRRPRLTADHQAL